MLLAMSCITPVHRRVESNYRSQAFMQMKIRMKGKGSYCLGKSLPLDNVRRKGRQIVFWDGLDPGLQIKGSMRSFLKSFQVSQFYVAPCSGRYEQHFPLYSSSWKNLLKEKKICDICQRDLLEKWLGNLKVLSFSFFL